MPKGIIKTPSQEKKWEKAKEVAADQGKAKRWPLIMHIFKQMGGMSKADQDHQNVLVERALASQGKKTTIPQEAHEALHSWWKQNKEQVLSPKQKKVLSDIKSVKERRAKIGLVKSSTYLNDMSMALIALKNELIENLFKADKPKSETLEEFIARGGKVSRSEAPKPEVVKKPKSKEDEEEFEYSDWQPHPRHTPEDLRRINEFVAQGYHPREAAHMISPWLGAKGEAGSFKDALRSRVSPTAPSQEMMGQLKQIAEQWLELQKEHQALQADPKINPIIHARTQIQKERELRTSKFKKDYADFLASDEYKKLPLHEKHKADVAWKTKWNQDNPEHAKTLEELTQSAAKKMTDATAQRAKHVQEIAHYMVHGTVPEEKVEEAPEPTESRDVPESEKTKWEQAAGSLHAQESGGEISETPTSGRAIAEHMGSEAGDDEEKKSTSHSITQDLSSKFAAQNPKFIESVLKPQVGERKSAQPAPSASIQQQKPKVQAPSGEPKTSESASTSVSEKPKTQIKRIAREDQLDRLKRIDAAKLASAQSKIGPKED
jgi:hypothetical protein